MLCLPHCVGCSVRPGRDCFTSLIFYSIEHIAGDHNIWQMNKWIAPFRKASKRAPFPFQNSDTLYGENRTKWQLNWVDPTLRFPVHHIPYLATMFGQNLKIISYLNSNIISDFPIANIKSLIKFFPRKVSLFTKFRWISHKFPQPRQWPLREGDIAS